jgi:hypothetical protein
VVVDHTFGICFFIHPEKFIAIEDKAINPVFTELLLIKEFLEGLPYVLFFGLNQFEHDLSGPILLTLLPPAGYRTFEATVVHRSEIICGKRPLIGKVRKHLIFVQMCAPICRPDEVSEGSNAVLKNVEFHGSCAARYQCVWDSGVLPIPIHEYQGLREMALI